MSLRPLRLAVASAAAAALLVTGTATASMAAVSAVPAVGWVPNAGVHALAADGTWRYLGGAFTSLTNPTTHATVTATRLTRLSVATGAPDPTWSPTVDGDIRAMVLDPTTSLLYLGGDFQTVDGAARSRLASVSTSGGGAVGAWNPGADSLVKSMIQTDAGTIYVAGQFLHIGTAARAHVARISPAGVLDATFKPKINNTVYSLAQPAGSTALLIGGNFTMVGGLARKYIAQIDPTTAATLPWYPGDPCGTSPKVCPVFAFVATPTAIYAAAGGPGGHTLAYDPATAAVRWSVGSDGDNQALALIGSVLYIGGHFGPSFGHATRTALAAVDATTGALDPWAPTAATLFPGVAAMIPAADGSLVIGGDITKIGGTTDARYAVFPASPSRTR